MTTIDLIPQQVEQVNFYKNNLKLQNYDPLYHVIQLNQLNHGSEGSMLNL